MASAKALKQIETQDYAAELRAVGASVERVRSDSRPGSG
jgi:hypothetical protein